MFHLLLHSCLLLSCLVLSSFVFSSLVSPLPSSLLSLSLCLCLCLCLCLSVSLSLSFSVWCCGCCVVLCCVVVLWCVCGVVCGTVKKTVCPLETCPCVRSKRPRVYRQHAHMLKHMCAWCRYTRGCFGRTHGHFLSGHGEGRRQFSLPKFAHVWLSRASEAHRKKPVEILPISSLRRGRERHVPDSSNHSRYLIKLLNSSSPEGHCGGNQPPDGAICLSPPRPNHSERFARPSTMFSFFATFLIYIYIYVYVYLHVFVNRQRHHNIRNGIVWVQTGHSTCTFTAHIVCG